MKEKNKKSVNRFTKLYFFKPTITSTRSTFTLTSAFIPEIPKRKDDSKRVPQHEIAMQFHGEDLFEILNRLFSLEFQE